MTLPKNQQPNIRRIDPSNSFYSDGIVVDEITPRITDWIPKLLEKLLPTSIFALRRYIGNKDPYALETGRYCSILCHLEEEIFELGNPRWRDTTSLWSDSKTESVEYIQSIVEFAVKYNHIAENELDDLTSFHKQNYTHLKNTLTKIGTGRGSFNGGLEALAKGPVRLHQEIDGELQPLTLVLDGESWSNLNNRKTGVRALAAIAVLGSAFDIHLAISPALENTIKRRYPKWYNAHLDLTQVANGSPNHTVDTDDQTSQEQLKEAWKVLQDLPEASGRIRLLGNLPIEGKRDYRDLKQDDEIAVKPGTVDRYVPELEEQGLVDIDRRGKYNNASLTSLGRLAVKEFLTEDYRIIHPSQSTLQTVLTPTPQSDAGTVYSAQLNTEGVNGGLPTATAEEWMAATGSPSDGDNYVQWLGGPSNRLDAWNMHQRYAAGRRNQGVNLTDDRLSRFDNGRITYLSCFEDDLLVIGQWGGPLPTLGRIAGALLSNKALSKILTPSALGSEFEEIDDAVVNKLDEKAGDIIRWGHQIGWFSEDEEHYDGWRDRIGTVRSLCLEKVGELTNSDDVEARTELFRDLQGLIASATQLYFAIGVDVTINVRMPDTGMLIREEKRLNDFLDFTRYTVPKQSVYGIHSGYRMILEDREQKLKMRLPYNVDDTDPAMHLTASWVFSGPTMTDLKPQIESAIEREASEIREAVADGTETAPVMEIPVQISNSYTAIRDLVEEYATSKGYNISHRGDIHEGKHDLERLTRLFLRVLGTEDRPHRACPHDVAEAMLSIARSTRSFDFISIKDIAYGLSQLPAGRLLPELPPTATKLLKTLLDADEPMGRSTIIEAAGISGSSYDRYINELAAWDIIEPTQIGGRRRWEAHIEPWWTPQSDREEPFAEPNQDTGIIDAMFPRDVTSAVMCHLTTHYELPGLKDAYLDGIDPGDDIRDLFSDHDRLRRWWPFIWGAFADSDELEPGPQYSSLSASVVVRIGPPSPDIKQVSLRDASDASIQQNHNLTSMESD